MLVLSARAARPRADLAGFALRATRITCLGQVALLLLLLLPLSVVLLGKSIASVERARFSSQFGSQSFRGRHAESTDMQQVSASAASRCF